MTPLGLAMDDLGRISAELADATGPLRHDARARKGGIAQVVDVVERWRQHSSPSSDGPLPNPRGWLDYAAAAIGTVASVQVALAFLAATTTDVPNAVVRVAPVLPLLTMLMYFASGAVLLGIGTGNAAAIALGFANLGIASAFAHSVGGPAPAWLPLAVQDVWNAVVRLPGDLALVVGAWTFVLHFPRVELGARLQAWVRRLAGAAVTTAFVLLVLHGWFELTGRNSASVIADLAILFDRRQRDSNYWPLVFPLLVMSVPFAVLKLRRAVLAERRRARAFLWGLSTPLLPLVVLSVLGASSATAAAFLRRADVFPWATIVVFCGLWILPLTTGVAVLRDGILGLKFVLRRSLQYTMARSTLSAAIVIPATGGVLALLENQQRSIGEFLNGGGMPWMVSMAGALVLAGVRRDVLRGIDRLFLRHRADVHRLVREVTAASRRTLSAREVAASLAAAVEATVHPSRLGLLVVDAASGDYVPFDGAAHRLHRDSAVVAILQASSAALVLDPGVRNGIARLLPTEERAWCSRGDWALLLPIHADLDTLCAIVCVGKRLADTPYTIEDHAALETICASVGPLLAAKLRPTSGPVFPDAGVLGMECSACGGLAQDEAHRCACRATMVPSLLPDRVGRFILRRRIGRGGMGVVYEAWDPTLNRSVALKALPTIGPGQMAQLQEEAEMMAALPHPGLAFVLGLESCAGVPVIVVEYMGGGTLHDQLRVAPLERRAVVELGLALAESLEYLHSQGVLHRDLKPSNIGITSTGHYKLLDFGIAVYAGRSAPASGTPGYLCPEASAGAPPSPAFDLWALAVVLAECWGVCDLVQDLPAMEGTLATVLSRALSLKADERYQSAHEFRLALETAR